MLFGVIQLNPAWVAVEFKPKALHDCLWETHEHSGSLDSGNGVVGTEGSVAAHYGMFRSSSYSVRVPGAVGHIIRYGLPFLFSKYDRVIIHRLDGAGKLLIKFGNW